MSYHQSIINKNVLYIDQLIKVNIISKLTIKCSSFIFFHFIYFI